jgi:hypothetical protein
MPEQAKVLVVAHQTAANTGLIEAIRKRAEEGPVTFHLVVPRMPHGMDRLANPQESGEDDARKVLEDALPKLSSAAGQEVTGSLGDAEPLMAIEDAINLGGYDEIIISTLPMGISRWLKLDLISKARGLGLPVTHVLAPSHDQEPAAASS